MGEHDASRPHFFWRLKHGISPPARDSHLNGFIPEERNKARTSHSQVPSYGVQCQAGVRQVRAACSECSIPPSDDRTNNSIFATKIADPIPVSCGERESGRVQLIQCSGHSDEKREKE